MINSVCIIGLGLIGGSLGKAIKKKKLARVIGLTSDKIKAALATKLKAVDYASTNIKGTLCSADIIFICYPIHLIIPELKKILQFVRPGTIITDVGSTKGYIVNEAEKLMPKDMHFIGGHPMAGKELVGLEASDVDLLNGKTYVLTKTKKTDTKALNELKEFLAKLGAKVEIMDPQQHDEIVAGVSHMPIAIAASLVSSVLNAGKLKDSMMKLASSGFKDSTRIASGDPTLGMDMFTTNKKPVLKSIKSLESEIKKMKAMITRGSTSEIHETLKKIKDFRDKMYQ